MYCKKCGTKVEDTARYCHKCGTQLLYTEEHQQNWNPKPLEDASKELEADIEAEMKAAKLREENEKIEASRTETNRSLENLLTIISAIAMVIFAFYTLRNFFSAFALILHNEGLSSLFFGFIQDMLSAIAECSLTILFGLFAFRRKKSQTIELFLALPIGLCIYLLIHLLLKPLSSLSSLPILSYSGHYIIGWLAIVAILAAMLAYGLKPFDKINTTQPKALFADIVNAIMEAISLSTDEPTVNDYRKAQKDADMINSILSTAEASKERKSTVDYAQTKYRMKTNRSLLQFILLNILTCGLYSYYFIYTMARDVNELCSDDGEKTGGLLAFLFLSFITCGFYSLYWIYKIGNRLAQNSHIYGIQLQENGTTVLLWCLLGSLFCGLGTFVAMHILIKNTNRLAIAYNQMWGM
ncbi:MAG: DUF4234 domain-containing protein [Solobacterium sp.]|nr:DUF4234 domain-containing protein [Solobacterium sp.]